MIQKGTPLSNIWKKHPKKSFFDYPGWDNHGDKLNELTDNIFCTRKKVNIYSRDFKYRAYTPYKIKATVFVDKRGHIRRVRYYGGHSPRPNRIIHKG